MQFVKSTSEYQLPPEGNQEAVIAEVNFAMIENRFSKKKEKEKELKLIISFELAVIDKKGNRFVKDLELYPSITIKNQPGKMLASLAGMNEKVLLSQPQLNSWVGWLLGDLVIRDGDGKVLPNEDGFFQVKDFDSEEDLIRYFKKIDEPPCVGRTCFVQIVYNENETSGKTYANIKGLYANAKLNDKREVMRDPETKKMIPAFELELSNKYETYQKRMRDMQERMNKANGGGSSSTTTKSRKNTDPDDDEIPF